MLNDEANWIKFVRAMSCLALQGSCGCLVLPRPCAVYIAEKHQQIVVKHILKATSI